MTEPAQDKLGDALKRAIAVERTIEESEDGRKSEKSVLLNPTRAEIYQYLCKNPCCRVRAIEKALELAVPTIEWHLRKLVDNGFITMKNLGKNKIYYPTDMIDPDDIEVLALISRDKTRIICSTVADNPGITQGQLGKELGMYQQEIGWYTSKLTEKRVLSTVKDGKFKHYYINDKIGDMLHLNRDRKNHFKKTLIRALKKDGVKPEIIRSGGDLLFIQMGTQKEKMILKVNLTLNPMFLFKGKGNNTSETNRE